MRLKCAVISDFSKIGNIANKGLNWTDNFSGDVSKMLKLKMRPIIYSLCNYKMLCDKRSNKAHLKADLCSFLSGFLGH